MKKRISCIFLACAILLSLSGIHIGIAVETDVALDKNTVTIAVNETCTLTLSFVPEDATNKKVTWSSSDKSVATVSNGKVKGIKPGTAVITVTSEDSKRTASCNVTVVHIALTGIAFTEEKQRQSVEIGKKITLKPDIAPQNASNKKINWTSADPSIATVTDKGVVQGIKAGVVTVTAEAEEGKKTAACEVTVFFTSVEKISLNEEYTVDVGKTRKI
ncbi:MAG: Ig-like domain-containing protein, partial [Oscillospiraceae bacterium]|nr:Ig-like domain-containing protein [Oscillospiraceae bacterium]